MPVFTILVILANYSFMVIVIATFSKIGGNVIEKLEIFFKVKRERKTKMSKKKIIPTPGSLVQSFLQ